MFNFSQFWIICYQGRNNELRFYWKIERELDAEDGDLRCPSKDLSSADGAGDLKERMLTKYTSVRDWVYTRLGNDLVTGVRRARPYDVQVYFSLVHLFSARCNLFVIFIAIWAHI